MIETTTGRDPDVLTTQELAARLGLSPQTVRRMAHAGQLPALKTGKDFRYSWETVRDVLRRGAGDLEPEQIIANLVESRELPTDLWMNDPPVSTHASQTRPSRRAGRPFGLGTAT
ncbi:MAG: DNA-binding protein [Actinomycetia bacterium]|jgi:excisionase family DNA binding protein|nr:DNA-binding protein [Actinomycetes bacterium]